MLQDGLAGSCVLPDEQSFSSGGGDAQRESRGRDALVLEHLYLPVQPASQIVRAFVQRTLQIADCGRQWQRLPANGVRFYVHLNPVRAKLLTPEQRVSDYAWSSWPEYLKAPEGRPRWLRVDRLLGEMGIPADSAAGRAELENDLERRRAEEEDYKGIRRGWCLGGETFREELLAQARAVAGEIRVLELKIETEEQNEFNLK